MILGAVTEFQGEASWPLTLGQLSQHRNRVGCDRCMGVQRNYFEEFKQYALMTSTNPFEQRQAHYFIVTPCRLCERSRLFEQASGYSNKHHIDRITTYSFFVHFARGRGRHNNSPILYPQERGSDQALFQGSAA